MPRKVITRTGKAGATAADRRILAGITATTAAPSAVDDGFLLERDEFIHLLFVASGTIPSFTIQVWYYSSISERWHEGESQVVTGADMMTIEVQGLERIYVQITARSGTLPVLNAWLANVVPV